MQQGFEQWLREHFTTTAILFVLAAWKIGPLLWRAAKGYFDTREKIHKTERELNDSYTRQLAAKEGDLQRSEERCKTALNKLEEARVKMLDLARDLDIREDLARQDRIARAILRRHLKLAGADLAAVEHEIREEIKKVIGDDERDTGTG